MGETRKLAAILVSDIVGYSRLAGADEDRALARLRGLRSDLIDPAITAHRGGLVERNAGLPPERRIEFRVGIHVGDVVEETDGDLMGDGVNIAARLESVAE